MAEIFNIVFGGLQEGLIIWESLIEFAKLMYYGSLYF